jgi:peptidoglycan hydrolase-like protein with peptidoglycan-binding domain
VPTSSGVPAYPAAYGPFRYGQTSGYIKQFQDQMHHRGFLPPGTGYFGPLTLALVKRLQSLNGLPAAGYIGPNTWRLAWTGTYSLPSSSGGTPAYPSSGPFEYGDSSPYIKQFQDQMSRRGFLPPGTGYYGPLTGALVRRLQALNHLPVSGWIGPNTWRAAWTGTYSYPTSAPAPAFPGSRSYHYGDWNNVIKAFQNQMHARGYFPVGTGQYGPLTSAMTKQLQRLNGLPATGELGPHTWALAWTGRYRQP